MQIKYKSELEKVFDEINEGLVRAEWLAEDLIDYAYEYKGSYDIGPSIDILKNKARRLKEKFISIDKNLCKEKSRQHAFEYFA